MSIPQRAHSLGPTAVRRLPVVVAALCAGFFSLLAGAMPADAAANLVVSAGTTASITAGSTGALSGLSVSGDATDTLQATLSTSVGTVSMASTAGVTVASGSALVGRASITISGLESRINAALATAALTPGNTAGASASINLAVSLAQPGVIYNASNQHYYQYVAAPGITWQAADAAAKAKSYGGQPGYLAAIPSSVVNGFISSRVTTASNVWFGARDYENSGNGYARTWQWAKGTGESPIAGTVISYCANMTSTCNFANNSGLYSSWNGGEPNNYSYSGTPYSGEWVAVTNWLGAPGMWNDLAPTGGTFAVSGYVVEYGDRASGSTGFIGAGSASATVRVVAQSSTTPTPPPPTPPPITPPTPTPSAPQTSVPAAPTSVTATAGNTLATVAFVPGASDGIPVTGYRISASPGGRSMTCNVSPCVFTGLRNGKSYLFTVSALGAQGASAPSAASNSVTPATVPDAPSIVSVTSLNGGAQLRWNAPADDGGMPVTSYTVSATSGGIVVTCNLSPCVVTGLTNGESYSFTVHATTAIGSSPESSVSETVIPAAPPRAVARPTVLAGVGQVVVIWRAPTQLNGSVLTGYTVISSPAGVTCAVISSTKCVITSVPSDRSYSFRVVVHSTAGDSEPSAASRAVTVLAPPLTPELTLAASIGFSAAAFAAVAGMIWLVLLSRRPVPLPTIEMPTPGQKISR